MLASSSALTGANEQEYGLGLHKLEKAIPFGVFWFLEL